MGTNLFTMTAKEKRKISELHQKLEKDAKDKKEELKKGLQQPDKKENKKAS